MRWLDATRWLALLCGLALAVPLGAQQPALGVRRIGPERLVIEAGTQATLTFRVSNRSASDRVVEGRIALPDSWSLVIPESPFSLGAHEDELRLVRISLPANANAGAHVVHYTVPGTKESDSVLVRVPERRRIEAAVLEAPRFVSAGDPFTTRFVLRNRGNVGAVLHLSLPGTDGVSARLDSAIVHLAAGAEAIVRADVQTAGTGPRKMSQRVRLIATVEGDSARIEPVVSVIDVIPRGAERAPRFRTLGSELTLRHTEGGRRPAVELRGGGAIGSDGRGMRTDFLLRTPSDAVSLSGEQDEYSLALSSHRLRLQLGDQSAPYSRLGESWRSGFGASGQLALGALTLGGFSRRDRRIARPRSHEEHGGSLELRLHPHAVVEGRLLSRSGVEAGNVWTVRALLAPSAALALDGEMAGGRTASSGGTAYAVALTGAFPRASYAARRIVTDSGFPGLTRGMISNELTGTLVPFSRLSVTGSFTDWIAERTSAFTSWRSESQRAVDGRVAWGTFLDAGYRRTSETRFVFATPRSRRTESARLQGAIPLGILSVRGGIEQGVSRFADQGWEPVPFRRLSLGGTLARGENLLSVSTEWLSGMPATSWVPERYVRLVANGQARLTPSTRISASLGRTSYAVDDPRASMTLEIGVAQALPFGHRAAWRTRAASYGPAFPAVRPQHEADYVIPLGLPVGMSGSGTVVARVIDRDAARPLAGVLLRIGDQTRLTNEAGEATFTRLVEQVQYLEVERATLGMGRMVLPSGPIGVRVRAGSTETIDLAVRRSARLQGTARRFEARAAAVLGGPEVLEDSGAVAGAIMQLANEADTLRTAVDASGRFTFAEVAPGGWTLSVARADLPRYRRFEDAPRAIILRGGETQEIALRVVPAAPQVQVIAQAELTLDGPGVMSSSPAGSAASSVRWVAGRRRIVPPPEPATPRIVPAPPDPQWDSRQRRIVHAPKGTNPSAPDVTRHHYTVAKRDADLVYIARAMYGDDTLWPKIWLANLDLLDDPEVIRPGLRLRIPDKAPLTDAEREAGGRYPSLPRRVP